jgi:hypothetical protein
MTPKQLAELDVYLAAGFDFPTAMAMIQPDEGGEDDADEPAYASPRGEPSTIGWLFVVCLPAAILALCLWFIWKIG